MIFIFILKFYQCYGGEELNNWVFDETPIAVMQLAYIEDKYFDLWVDFLVDQLMNIFINTNPELQNDLRFLGIVSDQVANSLEIILDRVLGGDD